MRRPTDLYGSERGTVVGAAPPLRSVSYIVILQTDMGAAGRGTLTVTLQAANTAVAAGVGAGPWSIAQKDSGWSAGHSDDTDWAGRGLCVLPLAPIRPSPSLDEY